MFAGFGTDKDGAIKHSNGVISFLNGGNNTTVANLTERMRIDSSGNVGIGTSTMLNPSSGRTVLTLGNSTSAFLNFGTGSTRWGGVYSDASKTVFVSDSISTFDVGGSERMRIDSSGNLLVGKSASSFTTAGVELAQGGTAGKVQIQRSSSPLTLVNLTDEGNILNFYKGTSAVGSIGAKSGDLTIGTDDTGLRFGDGGNSVIPHNMATNVTSNGVVSFGTATEAFNSMFLTGGVYLGGTGAANKLDDYEEGSFTPVIADAASGGNVASGYGNQAGFYTKVGRLVTCVFDLTNIATVGMTNANDIFIRDLPFTAASLAGAVQFTAPVIGGGTMTSALSLYAALQDNGSYVRLINSDQPAISNFLAVSNINSGATDLRLSITYFAA